MFIISGCNKQPVDLAPGTQNNDIGSNFFSEVTIKKDNLEIVGVTHGMTVNEVMLKEGISDSDVTDFTSSNGDRLIILLNEFYFGDISEYSVKKCTYSVMIF